MNDDGLINGEVKADVEHNDTVNIDGEDDYWINHAEKNEDEVDVDGVNDDGLCYFYILL